MGGIAAYIQVLSWHLPGRTERNHDSCSRANQWLKSAEYIEQQVRCCKVKPVWLVKIEKDLKGRGHNLLGSQELPGSNVKIQQPGWDLICVLFKHKWGLLPTTSWVLVTIRQNWSCNTKRKWQYFRTISRVILTTNNLKLLISQSALNLHTVMCISD